MSYVLYKSNGQRLVTVVDGSIDKATTDLTFVGKNYAGYGEILNQNLAKLLENFADNNEPVKPMVGQLWYDTVDKKIKMYDGTRFKALQNIDSGTSRPSDNTKGDFWYDETTKKLKFYDGSKFVTIGPADDPEYNSVKIVAVTVVDEYGLEKNALRAEIDDGTGNINVPMVIARDSFAVNSYDTLNAVDSFGNLQRGITLPQTNASTGDSTSGGYYFWGTAGTALGLVEKVGTTYNWHNATEYLRKVDFDAAINDGVDIPADYGLSVGLANVLRIHADSNTYEGKISATNGTSISINLLYNSALTNVITFAENNILPNTAIGMNIGTSAQRFASSWITTATSTRIDSGWIYANTYTGAVVGNVTGNITGNLNASIVTATNAIIGTLNATNISIGSGSITGPLNGNITTALIQANGGTDYSPAQIRGAWTLVGNSTLRATYADLAEKYHADAEYDVGTVLVLGGVNEVTVSTTRGDTAVAGIVSINAAYKMNSEAGPDNTHPYVALAGRVPCKVVGPIKKGELLVTSAHPGYACSAQSSDNPNAVLGKALEDFAGDFGVIEVKV